MDKEFIRCIQKRSLNLLRKYGGNKPLYLLAQDNCSELSRLVGCWILQKQPKVKMFILKGQRVANIKNKCHDILAVEYYDKIYLIDVTVWQFFKYKRSILIGIADNLKESWMIAKKIYKGNWHVSERLDKSDFNHMNKWKKIVVINGERL